MELNESPFNQYIKQNNENYNSTNILNHIKPNKLWASQLKKHCGYDIKGYNKNTQVDFKSIVMDLKQLIQPNCRLIPKKIIKPNKLVRYSTYSKRFPFNKSLSSPQSERIINMVLERRQCLKKITDFEESLKNGKIKRVQASSTVQIEDRTEDYSLFSKQSASVSIKPILWEQEPIDYLVDSLRIYVKTRPKKDYTESSQRGVYQRGKYTRRLRSYCN